MTSRSQYNLRPRSVRGRVWSGQKYSTIHLRLLSAELRDMIFSLLLLRSDGKTPALLIALRQDQELYTQALRVYYKVNEMEVLRRGGLEWLEGLKGEVRDMVKSVVVTLP
jgi:hypothetical protein